MDKTLIYLLVFIGLFGAFIVGFFFGLLYGFEVAEENEELELDDAYCYQCEIEMPTKVKNGRLHCSNCGLRH